jgi:hypothetical protein
MQAPAVPGGGSFLGTAAATAAGMIGGSLLMNGIRSALGGHNAGPFTGAFDSLSGRGGGDRSPGGGNAANSDLARDAGLNDLGSSRNAPADTQRAGLFGSSDDDDDSTDDSDDSDFDDGDDESEEA